VLRPFLLILLIALALAAGGCGSDDQTGSASQPGAASTESQSQTATTPTTDTTTRTSTAGKTTSTATTKSSTTTTVKPVKPKKPTQKPVALSDVHKREAAIKRARTACRANSKLQSSGGIPCDVATASDQTKRSDPSTNGATALPTCPKGKNTLNGGPCRRRK
jgi:hypothetical protein